MIKISNFQFTIFNQFPMTKFSICHSELVSESFDGYDETRL